MKRLIVLFLICTSLSACVTLKRNRLWKKGDVRGLEEKVSFPFTEKWGMIFLPVTINGQTFNFLLDTGAPNVLDLKTLEALNIPTYPFGMVTDAYGNRNPLNFTITDQFTVGPLEHKKIGALIADFRSVPIFDCMEIDGLIGSNMMRKAVWQFDFRQKTIHVAPDASHFDLKRATPLRIRTKGTGTPITDIQLGPTRLKNQTVDFGSGNGITVLREKVPSSSIRDTVAIGYGNAGTGLYGASQDTVYYLRTDSLQIGPDNLSDAVLRARNNTGGLLGLKFWRNYTVTIDWSAGALYLEPYQDTPQIQSTSFGFGTDLSKDTLRVSSLTEPSPASEAGLQLQDRIIRLGNTPVAELDYCQVLEQLDTVQQIQLTIENGHRTQTVKLVKRDLYKSP